MSIRSRLLLLTLLATLLPALLGLVRFLQARDATIEADTALLAQLAQQHADMLNERVQGTAQLLYGLARAGDLLAPADRAACSAFLSEVREAYPQYTGILTIRPDGRLFCDSLRSSRELDLRDRAYFKAASRAAQGVVLEPTFGRLTGTAVLQVAHPVRSAQGDLQFVLLASLNLQKLAESQALSLPGAHLLLISAQGQVLARSRDTGNAAAAGASLVGTPLMQFIQAGTGPRTAQVTDAAGQPQVWAHADTPGMRLAQLHVVTGVPKRALVQEADRRFRQDLALLGGAALALFMAVWLLAEMSLRRQVVRITQMANRLAAGDLGARIAPPLPRGELGGLMAVLNQTATALEQQRRAIADLDARLQHSQRMESIGQLTGGIAHDFNNLLTVVSGNAELLLEDETAPAAQRPLVQMIAAAAQRGAALTQRLLAFARKQALNPRPVDLNRLLAGLVPMLRRTLGESIQIELTLADGLWPALVDLGQLENAVLNLCQNARDAMPEGGPLRLVTTHLHLDGAAASQRDLLPGDYVVLTVADAGQGIAPEHLQRVIDPFFTTKPKDKGTGLGLSMVYGFVKQSAGHLAIDSAPGQGTRVTLCLPRAGAMAAGAVQVEAATDGAAGGGTEIILLVEDDDAVRQVALTALQSFGYTVIAAANGPAALALLAQRPDVDLLFTDVVMPGMNGRALADAARQIRPGLRVLYTSGYTEDAIVHHGRLDTDALLLGKPYRRSELDSAIRKALARPRL